MQSKLRSWGAYFMSKEPYVGTAVYRHWCFPPLVADVPAKMRELLRGSTGRSQMKSPRTWGGPPAAVAKAAETAKASATCAIKTDAATAGAKDDATKSSAPGTTKTDAATSNANVDATGTTKTDAADAKAGVAGTTKTDTRTATDDAHLRSLLDVGGLEGRAAGTTTAVAKAAAFHIDAEELSSLSDSDSDNDPPESKAHFMTEEQARGRDHSHEIGWTAEIGCKAAPVTPKKRPTTTCPSRPRRTKRAK